MSVPSIRLTQAERTETTRKLILDAVIRIMARKGAAGLRTGEVAKEAGVSIGAQLHHFPTKNELIRAAFEFVNERATQMSEQRARFALRARGLDDVIDAVVADATEFFFGNGFFVEHAWAMGQPDPALTKAVRKMSRKSRFHVEAVWQRTLQNRGLPEDVAADMLALTLNIVRGLAMRRFMDDDAAERARLIRVWREMIRAYLAARLGEQELARIFAASAGEEGQRQAAAQAVSFLSSDGLPETATKNKRTRKILR